MLISVLSQYAAFYLYIKVASHVLLTRNVPSIQVMPFHGTKLRLAQTFISKNITV